MRPISYTTGNSIALLQSGVEFFPALLTACEAARVEIYLETYIFGDDAVATNIKEALARAVQRGVTVKLIVDWIGTGNRYSAQLQREMEAVGVHCRVFNAWFKRGIPRTHRKLCVVDCLTAFVGGININDDWRDDENPTVILPAPRWDFAVQVNGPLVRIIHRELEAQWMRLSRIGLRLRWDLLREQHRRVPTAEAETALAGLVVRDNLRNRRTIERAYLQTLGRARESVWLANPYFAPNRKLRVALIAAAARGVQVTLLLGVGQIPMQDAVARSYYPKLLQYGVKIVEYRKTHLHGKVGVVDDRWATVGSSNYDGLSMFVNQEANVAIDDVAFARTLRERIEQGVADGVPVGLEEFASIPWYKRHFYDVAYQVYKTAIRIMAWGNY